MKYFVTGGTGFIGARLIKRLVESGHHVNALVRDPKKAEKINEPNVTLFQGDITRKGSLRDGMEGVDGVFHLAAWYKVGEGDFKIAERINHLGTLNVLETMKELGIPKGVYTSTLTVFSDTNGEVKDESYIFKGHHLSNYDHTKWRAHYEVARPMMLNQNLPLVIVMPGVVYGPGEENTSTQLIDLYLKEKLPFIPKETAWCWSHVDDIVQAHITAMEKGKTGETYIIGGEKRTVEEAMEIANDITGIKPPKLKMGPGILRFLSKVNGVVNYLSPLPPKYHPETLRVMAGVTYLGSNAKAKNDLEYDPRSLREGFRDYLPKRMDELRIDKGSD